MTAAPVIQRGPFGDYPEHPHGVFMERRLG
jgi:hypothetical protein